MRELILPNLKPYEKLLQDAISEDGPRRPEAERVLEALLGVLSTLQQGRADLLTNGHSAIFTDELREQLVDKLGELIAARIADTGNVQLARTLLED